MRTTEIIPAAALLTITALANGQSRESTRATTPSEAAVTQAVRDGADYLMRTQVAGRWIYKKSPFVGRATGAVLGADYDGGLTALALYALAAAGVAADHPAIQSGLAWCREHEAPFATGQRSTYSAALLVLALCHLDAREHKAWIHELAARLAASQLPSGAWSYGLKGSDKAASKRHGPAFAWLRKGDGSNTQFAVLALWSAQVRGQYRVPPRVWQRVRSLHERTQHSSGGWSYKEPPRSRPRGPGPQPPAWMYEPNPAMTAAGLVAAICSTAGSGGLRGLPRARRSKLVKRGAQAFAATRGEWRKLLAKTAFAWSLERVQAMLDEDDQAAYHTAASRLLETQWRDGRWGDRARGPGMNYGDRAQVYDTSLALLALTRATRRALTAAK